MTADNASRRSPLSGWVEVFAALPAAVRVSELPFLSQLNVRLAPAAPAAEAVVDVLGAALPTVPCTATAIGEYDLLWLGPDEWLVLAPPGRATELAATLRQAIGPSHGAVTDVSAQRTAVTLGGSGAREILAKGCSIDLHPAVTGPGSCVQTLLAQTGVTILVRGNGEFLLLVRASFADYLAGWLLDASTELAADRLAVAEGQES